MQMIVDAALITRKAPDADFNTDSLNASGKVWPREVVHSESGIKAAGKSQGRPYYVLSSAETKGTAESAADLFKQCLPEFDADGSNYSMVISDYFKAFAKVLNKSGFDSSACDICVFTGFEDSVYLAKSGNAKLFRYADGALTEAVPQMFRYIDNASAYGVCSFAGVKPGEVYLLVSGGVASVLSESMFRAICNNAGGDIKKIVALIASNAVKNGCTQAVSAVAIRIEEPDKTGDPTPETVDEPDPEPERDNPFLAEVSAFAAETSTAAAETVEYDDEPEPVDPKEKKERKFSFGSGRIAFVNIALIALVLIAAVALILIKGVFGKKNPGQQLEIPPDETNYTLETTTEESTTAPTAESTTAQPVSERATTARAVENVTSSTIRNRNETSTARTTPNTTEAPGPVPTTLTPVTIQDDEPTDPVTAPAPVTTEAPVTEPPTSAEPEPVTDEPEPSSGESETVDQIPEEFQ